MNNKWNVWQSRDDAEKTIADMIDDGKIKRKTTRAEVEAIIRDRFTGLPPVEACGRIVAGLDTIRTVYEPLGLPF